MMWNVINPTGINWYMPQCRDMGLVGMYPKWVPKYSNYVTSRNTLSCYTPLPNKMLGSILVNNSLKAPQKSVFLLSKYLFSRLIMLIFPYISNHSIWSATHVERSPWCFVVCIRGQQITNMTGASLNLTCTLLFYLALVCMYAFANLS